jgi:light-regulated signal transduction histidine kinase (bacteriophytochrome)
MTDMNALIDEVIGEFLEDAGSKASIRRTTTIPRLVCERFLVAELFYNLIDNAIKYSGNAAATIDIGSRAEGGRLTFYVRDFGVGIRFSDISSVVLPLKRADHRKLNMGATGMGLSQAKKIAERHGGTLWLESVVDSGTTVWFSLGDPL